MTRSSCHQEVLLDQGALCNQDQCLCKDATSSQAHLHENLYIANYNGPGQLVVTGARASVKKACKILKEMGAKRAFVLPQKGVGHSPNSAEEGAIVKI